MTAYQQFSSIIRNQAKLMSVPELVPDTSMLFRCRFGGWIRGVSELVLFSEARLGNW